MIICETEFEIPDPQTPDYAMTEIDIYSHIPYGKDFPQHRLTLRKNLKSGEYEVYRRFYERQVIRGEMKEVGGYTLITAKDMKHEEVAFHDKDLSKVLDFMSGEVQRFWGDRGTDKPCEHRPPNLRWDCRIWKELSVDEKIKAIQESRKIGKQSSGGVSVEQKTN